ncbi:Auxin Efflux Carrier family protein [Histomonas meleagridis]|uniref:Auxin Efflux Carrier family protein n=1 Tax=Histomonas meleagridis TaxID=135588 RepID=UPI00355ABCF2|nr:Auxin Efflux Carrier family protein [Histomonas meleagridis]KAH0802166.1 Auxin Efflux Carrier family protein [Histomonas meleagridis]
MIFLFKFQDKLKAYLSVTLPCSFVNYLVIGIPIFNAIWGEENNVVVSLISLSNDLMTTPIYLVLSNIYLAINQKDDGHPKITKCQVFKNIIIRIVTSPIIIANVCGFIWSVIGWEFPEIIVSLTNFSGNIVLGISLLCVGGFIAQNSFIACKIAKLICCMLIRHIVMPLITMGFCFALKLNNDLSRQCVILQSLPTGTTSFVLSNAAGISPGVSSTMSFWSTCLSVLFIMLWMYILDALHLWVD